MSMRPPPIRRFEGLCILPSLLSRLPSQEENGVQYTTSPSWPEQSGMPDTVLGGSFTVNAANGPLYAPTVRVDLGYCLGESHVRTGTSVCIYAL